LFLAHQSKVTPQAASCREQEIAHRRKICALSDSQKINATFASPVYVRKRAFTEEELEGTCLFRKKTPKLPSGPSSQFSGLLRRPSARPTDCIFLTKCVMCRLILSNKRLRAEVRERKVQ